MDVRTFEFEYVTDHFERLIEEASAGDSFQIAQEGRPIVLVEAYKSPKKESLST